MFARLENALFFSEIHHGLQFVFRKPVFPGDQLRIEVTTTMNRRGIWGVAGKAFVGDALVTEADLKATFAS